MQILYLEGKNLAETLGKLQEKMLWHLAVNPDSLIQPIQKALKNYYKNVYDNIFNLKEKGYIQGKGDFRLTIKGIAYVMATATEETKAKTLRMLDIYAKYENAISDLDLMWNLFGKLSTRTSVKLLNNVGKALLVYGETVWSGDSLQRLVVSTFLNLSAGELKDLKRAIKSIPELRQMVHTSVEQARHRLLEDEGS